MNLHLLWIFVSIAKELDSLWDEAKRFKNPHVVYVDLSSKLYNMKKELLDGYSSIDKDSKK